MKLIPDLIRKILKDIEEKGTVNGYNRVPQIEGYSDDEVFYNSKRMEEAGFIVLEQSKPGWNSKYKSAKIADITYQGHQFLDLSRDSKIWNKAKETFVEKGLSWTFELGTKVLSKLNLEQLGDIIS